MKTRHLYFYTGVFVLTAHNHYVVQRFTCSSKINSSNFKLVYWAISSFKFGITKAVAPALHEAEFDTLTQNSAVDFLSTLKSWPHSLLSMQQSCVEEK
jgi:hypothetical protein